MTPESSTRRFSDTALSRLSIGLTIVAVLAATVGAFTSTLVLDDLGLAGGLSVLFWVGMVGLVVAALVEASRGDTASRRLMVVQIVAWLVLMWIVPTIIEGTPRFRTSYANYGYVDPLVAGDGFDRARFLYHNWPVFPLAMAALRSVGLSSEFLMASFPIIMMAAYVGLTAVLLSVLTPSPQADAQPRRRWQRLALGPWSLLVLFLLPVYDWTGQDYFSPQGLAFAFFLVFTIILAQAAMTDDRRLTGRQTIAILVVLLLIIATHVLTSLFALSVLAVLVVARRVRPWTVLVTSIVLFFVWQVYVAAPFYASYGDQLLEGVLRITTFLQTNVSDRLGGSPGHVLAAQLRVLATLVVFALAAFAFVIRWRRTRMDRTLWFAVAYLIGVALVIPISIYGGEAVIRGLLFSLPILLVLIAGATDHRAVRIAIAAALLVGVPLHVYTHYGNEAYDYVSPAELELFDEVASLAPANIYGGFPAGVYQETAHLESRNASLPRQNERTTVEDFLNPQDHNWADETLPVYVVLSRGDEAGVRLFRDEPELIDEVRTALDADDAFEVVFENEDGIIYLYDPDAAAVVRP